MIGLLGSFPNSAGLDLIATLTDPRVWQNSFCISRDSESILVSYWSTFYPSGPPPRSRPILTWLEAPLFGYKLRAAGRKTQSVSTNRGLFLAFGLWNGLVWDRWTVRRTGIHTYAHCFLACPSAMLVLIRKYYRHSAVTALICLVRIMCVVHVWIACLGIVQGDSGGRVPGLGWLIFSHSSVCLVLHGQMGIWQNRLVNRTRWWNIKNHSHPNQGTRPQESYPVQYCVRPLWRVTKTIGVRQKNVKVAHHVLRK